MEDGGRVKGEGDMVGESEGDAVDLEGEIG